jgi:hypothetical protein
MLVSPSKDGKRPGYRRSKYDASGGGTRSSKSAPGSPGPDREDRANLREQASVASTLTGGRKTPTMQEVKDIVRAGPDDRGNPLQNRNQRNIVEYNKNLKKIEEDKDLNFIEKFNAKKRLKNQRFINQKYSRLAAGMAQKYGLSQDQLQDLLEAYGRDEDQVGLFSKMQDILDMDPSARNLGQDFNEDIMKGALGAIELSPRMKKGVPLSTAELFDMTDPTSRIELPGILGLAQGDESFSNVLSGLNRLKTLDKISQTPGGVTQKDLDNYFSLTSGKGGIDPLTDETVDALFYEQPGNDRSPQETDPCLGPNPPAYCNVGNDDDEDATDPRTNFYGLSPRIGGSMFDFSGLADGGRVAAMDGGIMDVAREEMFLGGIAKGIKKGLKSVTRGLKKVVKSPIGKAALLGAVGYGLGGGTFFGKMLPGVTRGGQGFGGFGGLSSIFGNVGDMIGGKGLGDAFAKFGGNKALTGILGASILPLLLGKKEEDEFDIDAYYAANKLNRNAQLYNRIAGSQFSFAEGGEVEPVAKKTMPLLDMGGQEMDLRAEGGFVPIGRMEKADDVPARLSKNEFVFTAEAVRNAGEGDVDKGAEVMYNMMKNLESGGEVSEESQGLEGAREMFKTSQRLGEVI